MRLIMMCPALAVLAWASPAPADTVTDWWVLASRYYNASQALPGPRAPDMDRAASRAAIAMFEAVNAIDRRYDSYLHIPAADPKASQDAAAATAGYRVLAAAYPANKAPLDESYALAMSQIPDGPAREAGLEIGEKAAAAALAVGGIDPAVAQPSYRPRTSPGEWIGASLPALDSYWIAFRPWVVASAEALRPPPPPALGSAIWARDYEEVRRLGGRTSAERTAVQTLIARYRQAFDVTATVRLATDAPGRRQIDNARLLALYQMAYDDAVQQMILAKLHYNFWRPITAIRNGDADGNPATQPDPNWTALLATPNFPEYPCGHCTVAAVIAEVMKSESGLPASAGVRVASLVAPSSVDLVLPSWDEWVRQVSLSRTLGGVHYRFSNEAGEKIGRDAARIVIAGALRPLAKGKH
ncbi:MAG: PA-phosphatase [Alphaproteobacteria bacterium]|nr:PA-phosphatase [Alphaproteobacteria bacterium]